MSERERPACERSPRLFDSEALLDHIEAKHICLDECTVMDWCKRRLRRSQELAMPGFGPSGTWAGQLIYSKDQRGALSKEPYKRRRAG